MQTCFNLLHFQWVCLLATVGLINFYQWWTLRQQLSNMVWHQSSCSKNLVGNLVSLSLHSTNISKLFPSMRIWSNLYCLPRTVSHNLCFRITCIKDCVNHAVAGTKTRDLIWPPLIKIVDSSPTWVQHSFTAQSISNRKKYKGVR